MRRTWITIISAIAMLSLMGLPTDAAKKKGPSQVLRVHVEDWLGRPLPWARVVIHRKGANGSAIRTTGRSGDVVVGTNPGLFSVTVTRGGFVRGGTVFTMARNEKRTVVMRIGLVHALIVHPHEAHHLGMLHRNTQHHDAVRPQPANHPSLPSFHPASSTARR